MSRFQGESNMNKTNLSESLSGKSTTELNKGMSPVHLVKVPGLFTQENQDILESPRSNNQTNTEGEEFGHELGP
jgi:hypothetical protein